MSYTIDQATTLLDRANPVPDPDDLVLSMANASRILTNERNTAMDTEQRTTQEPRTARRGIGIAIASFGVVILVVALVATALRSSDEVAADPDTTEGFVVGADATETPREAVDAFVEARNNGDEEATWATSGETIQISDAGLASREGYAGQLAWLEALDWRWDLMECNETAISEARTRLICGYEHSNAWSRAQGLDAIDDGGTFEFLVEDALVIDFKHNWRQTTFSPEVWGPFIEWVDEYHADIADQILTSDRTTPIRTGEAIVLWRTVTEDYLTHLGA